MTALETHHTIPNITPNPTHGHTSPFVKTPAAQTPRGSGRAGGGFVVILVGGKLMRQPVAEFVNQFLCLCLIVQEEIRVGA